MRQFQLPAAESSSEVPASDVSNEKDDGFGPGASRLDSHFYTASESAQRASRADEMKQDLAAKSATQRKFDLLNVTVEDKETDFGTQFVIVDLNVLNVFFATTKCEQCGMAAPFHKLVLWKRPRVP